MATYNRLGQEDWLFPLRPEFDHVLRRSSSLLDASAARQSNSPGGLMIEERDLRGFDGRARIFPLPEVVLLPHGVIPLHIFEPRYRQMMRDALSDDKLIAIVRQHPAADLLADDEPGIDDVGCLGRIIRHEQLPDGRFNLLLAGETRIRLGPTSYDGKLYRSSQVDVIRDTDPGRPLDARGKRLIELLGRTVSVDQEFSEVLAQVDSLAVLTDLIGQAVGFPSEVKQSLLSAPDPVSRCEILLNVLTPIVDKVGPRGPSTNLPFSIN